MASERREADQPKQFRKEQDAQLMKYLNERRRRERELRDLQELMRAPQGRYWHMDPNVGRR